MKKELKWLMAEIKMSITRGENSRREIFRLEITGHDLLIFSLKLFLNASTSE